MVFEACGCQLHSIKIVQLHIKQFKQKNVHIALLLGFKIVDSLKTHCHSDGNLRYLPPSCICMVHTSSKHRRLAFTCTKQYLQTEI